MVTVHESSEDDKIKYKEAEINRNNKQQNDVNTVDRISKAKHQKNWKPNPAINWFLKDLAVTNNYNKI